MARNRQDINLDAWNPMAEDYDTTSFNSYQSNAYEHTQINFPTRGVGSKGNGRGRTILYVNKIPVDLTSNGLRSLFSKCGRVVNSRVLWPRNVEHVNYLYGNVEYETSKEALAAIEMFNLTPPHYLEVRVYRQNLMRNSNETYSRPNSQGPTNRGQQFHAPLLPTPPVAPNADYYTGGKIFNTFKRGENTVRGRGRIMNSRNVKYTGGSNSLTHVVSPSSRGALSITFSPGGEQAKPLSPRNAETETRQVTRDTPVWYCVKCGGIGNYRCCKCKRVVYCSQQCQKDDWPEHAIICLPIVGRNVPSASMHQNTSSGKLPEAHQSTATPEMPEKNIVHPAVQDNKYKELKRDIKPLKVETPPKTSQNNHSKEFIMQKSPKSPGPSNTKYESAARPNRTPVEKNAQSPRSRPEEPVVQTTEPVDVTQKDNVASTLKPVVFDKGFTKVIVSHVCDPHNFYVQLSAGEESLIAIMRNIQGVSAQKPPDDVSCGEMVAAKFSDNFWYRSKIEKIDDGKLTVLYVDYGNSETVTLRDVRSLSSEMVDVPVQAVLCGLANIGPQDEAWNEAATMEFNRLATRQPLFASVQKVRGTRRWVTLRDAESEGNDIGELMIAAKMAIRSLPINDNAISFWKKDTEVTLTFPSRTTADVIWAMDNSVLTAMELTDILVGIADCRALPCSDLKSFSVGTLIAACSPADSGWYRAMILKVTEHGLLVRYLDFGNCEEVTDVRALPDSFCQYPSLAICLEFETRLAIEGFSDEFTSDDTLTLKIGEAKDDYFSVELLNEKVAHFPAKAYSFWSDKGKMTTEEASLKHAENEPPEELNQTSSALHDTQSFTSEDVSVESVILAPKKPISDPAATTEVSLRKLPKFDIPSGDVTVIPIHVDAVNKVYVQVVTHDTVAILSKLQNDIHSMCEDSDVFPLTELPPKGQVLCAKFSDDGCWYRAEVEDAISVDNIRVRFIDFGNFEITSVANLKPMPNVFYDYPTLSLPVYPEKVKPHFQVEELKEVLLSDDPAITPWTMVAMDQSTSPIRASLVASNGKTLEELLALKGTSSDHSDAPVHIEKEAKVPPEPHDSIEKPLSTGGSESLKTGTMYKDMERMQLPIGKDVDLIVVEIQSSDMLFCWRNDEKEIVLYDQLNEAINEYCTSVPNTSTQIPAYGEMCLARSEQYQQWYRATPIDTEDKFIVLLVDFGTMETVQPSSLRPIDDKFLELPVQAFMCTISGMENVPCSEQDLEKFKTVVKQYDKFTAKVLSKWNHSSDGYIINIPSIEQDLKNAGCLLANK